MLMKAGDLVNFVSGFFGGEDRYASPGIIIEDIGPSVGCHRRFRVLWSDQKITTEHSGYLEAANV
jgi:hypothetical protein